MTLSLILGLMAAAAIGLLLLPLIRGTRKEQSRAAYDAEVYRDQLAELDRDVARGVVDEAEAEAARAEIARRLIAATEALKADADGKPKRAGAGAARAVAIVLACVIPLGAGGLYFALGSPGMPGHPLSARQAKAREMDKRLASAIETLEARLKKNPKSVPVLVQLGRLRAARRDFTGAAEAYKRALAERPNSAVLAAAYGEALVFANRRTVTEPARAAFERALKSEPRNLRARFYIGLAKLQGGDANGALRDWLAVEADTPANAPWRAQLAQQIEAAAKQVGLNATGLARLRTEAQARTGKKAGDTARGPSREDIERAKRMKPTDRAKMIRSMVDGLAERLKENPDDLAGWRRLARAYMVLREPKKAEAAYAQAARLAPKNLEVLIDYAKAMLTVHGRPQNLPPKFVALMRRVREIDPKHPFGLWFLGLAAHEAGDSKKALELWERLLTQIPKQAPERAALAKRIEMLKMKKK